MISIRLEKSADAAAREALLDAAYGPVRFTKPSERLRAGRKPARGLSFVAVEDGRVVGTRTAVGGIGRIGLPGAAARPARGRSGATLPWHRLGADAACPPGRYPARPPRRAAGRRRRLLWPLRLLGGENRHAVAAGPRRQKPSARPGACGRCARGRAGRDPRTGAKDQAAAHSGALPTAGRRAPRSLTPKSRGCRAEIPRGMYSVRRLWRLRRL